MNLSKLRILILSLICTIVVQQSYAQEVGAKVDFFGYADNREYTAPYTIDKTYFGTIISPQLYFKLNDNHALIGGLHYRQDFGITAENKSKVAPIAYYKYTSSYIDFGIGFMPRHEKLVNIPLLVLSDTLMIERPNLEGMFFKFNNQHITQSIFIDWLSKQGTENRERFIAGISGLYRFGKAYFANDGTLYHNALTLLSDPDNHIQDNAVLVLRLGLDLSESTSLDSLTIDAGTVLGFDRVRTEYEKKSNAFISNIHAQYKNFFLHNTLYMGNAIFLPNGDSFYRRDKYNRIDIGWIPFRNKNIDAKFTASFHLRQGGIDNQQAFTIRYSFDRIIRTK